MNAETSIPSRLHTGVPGLDDLLGGGLLRGRTVLLKGSPGSGKTTLGLQMLVEGARKYNEPGILLTFEQIPDQIFQDASEFGWDLRELRKQNLLQVQFIKPEEVLEAPGRQENRLLVQIADWVDEFGAGRILIDSISHLRGLFAGDEARALLMKFLVQLKALGLTPILTAELAPQENMSAGMAGMDAYLVDTVMQLHRAGGARLEAGRSERREIEIAKTRGQRHVGGLHPFQICDTGIVVYPRLDMEPDGGASLNKTATSVFISSGVPGLDSLLGGGLTPGSSVLVAGLSGTFKTALAAHFALAPKEGATDGTLWITLQEGAAELDRNMAARGLDFAGARAAGRIHCVACTPGRDPIEKILAEAEELVVGKGLARVVVDGIDELTAGFSSDAERHEAAAWFLRRLRSCGVTVLLTQRLARVSGPNPLSDISTAGLADTIIYLGLVEIESRLEKVVSVLKHRGGAAAGDLRSIMPSPHGLRVLDRFVGLSGVLHGTPLGRRKTQIEEIFQPLYFIRDFLALARQEGLDDVKRAAMLQNLSGETGRLIELLGYYFDQPQGDKADRASDKSGGGKS